MKQHADWSGNRPRRSLTRRTARVVFWVVLAYLVFSALYIGYMALFFHKVGEVL